MLLINQIHVYSTDFTKPLLLQCIQKTNQIFSNLNTVQGTVFIRSSIQTHIKYFPDFEIALFKCNCTIS